MEIDCVFTRELAKESYMQASETEIVDQLKASIEHFIEVSPSATLVEFTESGFKSKDSITPQPYVKTVVSCKTSPEVDLIKKQVTVIGEAEYFDEEIFPVRLLGPKYWVSDDVERSIEHIEQERENEQLSYIDSITEKLLEAFN